MGTQPRCPPLGHIPDHTLLDSLRPSPGGHMTHRATELGGSCRGKTMFSDLLGTKLPGRGTNWLKQSLRFPAPAFPGEPITATVEIIRLRPDKDLVNLRTVCANAAGVVCEGEALVLVKDLVTLA